MRPMTYFILWFAASSAMAQSRGILPHITPADGPIKSEVVLTNDGLSGGRVYLSVHHPDDVHITNAKRRFDAIHLQAGESRVLTSDNLLMNADYVNFEKDHDLIRLETRYLVEGQEPVYVPAQKFTTSLRYRLTEVKQGWIGLALVRDSNQYSPPMSELVVKALNEQGELLASSFNSFITRFDKHLMVLDEVIVGAEGLAFIEIESSHAIGAVLLHGGTDQLKAIRPWQAFPDGLVLRYTGLFGGGDSYRIEQKGNYLTLITFQDFRTEVATRRNMSYYSLQQFYAALEDNGAFELVVPSQERNASCDPALSISLDIRHDGQRNAFFTDGCEFLEDPEIFNRVEAFAELVKDLTDEIMLQE